MVLKEKKKFKEKKVQFLKEKMLFFLVLLAFCGHQTLAQYPAGACPEPYGIQTYPDEKYCDKFYKVNKVKSYFLKPYLRKKVFYDLPELC